MINEKCYLINKSNRSTEQTRHLVHWQSVGRSLRAELSAVIGTSVKAGWWTRQTEPDGSVPSGSSIQSTCINEDPAAGGGTKDTCTHSTCLCVYICACAHVNLGWPALASCCKLLPVDSSIFLVCLYTACRHSLPPGYTMIFFCLCMFKHWYTRVCCVCLLLFLPGADHFIHLTTIIKPIKKRVLPPMAESPYPFISYSRFYITCFAICPCTLYTIECSDYSGAVVKCEKSWRKPLRCDYYSLVINK